MSRSNPGLGKSKKKPGHKTSSRDFLLGTISERILEAVPDAVVVVDRDGKILRVNRQAESQFGYAKDELNRQPIEILVPERHRGAHPRFRQHYVQVPHARSMGAGLNLVARRKDGSEFPVEISLSPLRTQGEPVFLSFIRDITAQKDAEARILSSHRHLQAILSSTREAIFTVSMEGLVTACNPAAVEMMGYSKTEMEEKSTAKFYPSEAAFQDFKKQLAAALETHDTFSGEFELRRRNGSIFPAEFMVNRLQFEGERLGLVAVVRDVTQRKQSEEIILKMNQALEIRVAERTDQLREERDLLQRYLDVAGVMILVLNSEGAVSLINKKGCETLGGTESEIIGRNWFESFLPERFREATRTVFNQLMAGEIAPVEYFKNPVLTRSGEERIVQWHNTVLRDEDGTIYATLASGEDVTEKMDLEGRVRQAEKLAAVGQFTSGLAHEIGTPLSVIAGRAELMLRKMPPEDPLRTNLQLIIGQIERIIKIVKQLLSFTRSRPLEISPIRVRTLAEEVLQLFDHKISQNGIEVQFDIPNDLPPLMADRDQVQQVMFNVVLNALQAMPGGGVLQIRASRTVARGVREDPLRDQFMKIEIGDTGEGIPEENLDRIFDPFFTTKEAGLGTGLGLSMCYSIVKNHGGWIRVRSGVGLGTLFSLYLPAKGLGAAGPTKGG